MHCVSTRQRRWTASSWLLIVLAGLCLLPLLAVAQAPSPIPALTGPVVDSAGVLSAATTAQLRQQAIDLRQRKGAQLQVLLVDHVGAEGIEAYTQRVFEQWQLGRAGVDDGVLLLVAVQDRRVRIQTGYGLEGAIPDAYAARIIDGAMLPRFRQGQFDQGVLEGSAVLVGLIDGEPLPAWNDSRHVVLPSDWRWGDSLALALLMAGFAIGLMFSPRAGQGAQPQVQRARQRQGRRRAGARNSAADEAATRSGNARAWPWWWRPLANLAVIAAAALIVALWAPRLLIAFTFIAATAVPVATLLGWFWRRSGGLRGVLYAMLAVSAVFVGVMWLLGQPAPSLVLHGALNLAVGIAAMLVAFLVSACVARWRHSRRGFIVRASVLVLLTLGYAALVLLLSARMQDPGDGRTLAIVMSVIGSFLLYFAWILGMSSLQKGGGGSGGSSSQRSSSRSSGSSSSSSSGGWSGGGGSSGGGGASGSW